MTGHVFIPINSQIDRLLRDALQNLEQVTPHWIPACNVWEEGERFCIEVALPGWETKDVNLEVENGVLTLTGKQEEGADKNGMKRTYVMEEIDRGSFLRSFKLPSYLDWDSAHASLKNGVLLVEVQKRQNAQPKQLLIE